MMHHEVDYRRELDETRRFRELLRDDPRYVIPEPLLEYSTGRVLATSYEPGLEIDSPEVKALSQERRNALGVAALELYLRELLVWGRMQTDPHFGNYRVRISGDGARPDQLVLYDFGAVRKLDRKFLEPYRELIAGTFFRDRPRLIRAAIELGFLREEDSEQYKTSFAEISELFLEPFSSDGIYDWSKSDLPQRVTRKGAEMIWSAKLRPPPREVVFLDRKMGGVFILLSALGAKIRSRELLEKYFNQV